MPTAVRETVLDWVKTRLATISGYTVKRNPRDDLRASFPAIAFFDPPAPPPFGDVNAEYTFEMTVKIGVGITATGDDSGETAGQTLNDAMALIHNAMMDSSQWSSGSVLNVQPGGIDDVDFVAGNEAAQTYAIASLDFIIKYRHKDSDAYTATP